MNDLDTRTEAPLGKHTSFSQFSTFMRCQMKYWFRYGLKMRGRPSIPLARGKSGHAAVEWNFSKKLTTGVDQPTDQVLDLFSDIYDAAIHEFDANDFMPGDDPAKTKDDTIELLRFWTKDPKDGAPSVQPLAVELPFTLHVPNNEEYEFPIDPVVGRIDLLAQRIDPKPKPKITLYRSPIPEPPPPSEATDHKFVQQMKGQGDIDYSTQMDLYDAVLRQNGVKVDRLAMEYFVPATKTLGPRVKAVYRSPELMTEEYRENRWHRLVYKMRTMARAVKSGIFEFTDDPKICGTCEYRDHCQFSLVKDDYKALQIMQEVSR